MYNKTPQIIKYIDMNISTLFDIIFGSVEDEFGEQYVDIYKYEINTFINKLESKLNQLEKINILITKDILYQQILLNWNCGYEDELDDEDKISLNNFIDNILNNIYGEISSALDKNISNEFNININEKEKLYIQKELFSINHRQKMNLIEYIMKKEDTTFYNLYLFLKENDKEDGAYNLIISEKEDYINSTNLLYKLCKTKPDTDDSLHHTICRTFNIARDKFIF